MVGGRERQPPLCAISPGGQSERALGREMDRFRREVVQSLREPVANTDREPDPRFGGARYRSKQIRGQHEHLMSGGVQPVLQCGERARGPIDLRRPRIADEGNFHESSRVSAGCHAQFLSSPYPGSSMASAAFVSTRGGNLDGMSAALPFAPAG